MASGSQTWKGNWADLPMAPRNSSKATAVVTPWLKAPVRAASNASDMLKLPTFSHNSNMPISMPTSPMRVTTKAFLAASLAAGRSCQKPISRYEHSPTNSQTA